MTKWEYCYLVIKENTLQADEIMIRSTAGLENIEVPLGKFHEKRLETINRLGQEGW